MISLLLAAALAADSPVASASPLPQPALAEASHALASGRFDQARTMIGNAIKSGAKGAEVDRLVAELSFRTRSYADALVRYEALIAAEPDDSQLLENGGLSAIHAGELDRARALLGRAATESASWRVWNGLGVVADFRHDWAEADRVYARAAAIAPGKAEIVNNMGWSLLLRGDWASALPLLEEAAALDRSSKRIARNLELARAAIAEDLPRRQAGESDSGWAARLNDAGVMAQASGDNARAIAAFAQAINVRSDWFARAANNLTIAERKE